MKIIVKESQYKKIIVESTNKNIVNKISKLKNFFNDVSKEIKKQIGLDLSFLSTWGVTIGGFAKPVSDYIKGEFTGLSNDDLILLTAGLILTYYQSNLENIKKVINKIKERGLVVEFDKMLSVGEKLKNTFTAFIKSLSIPLLQYSNMLAYTFIIPLVGELFNLASGNFSNFDVHQIIRMIVGYLTINLSGNIIKKILDAIIKRFKS